MTTSGYGSCACAQLAMLSDLLIRDGDHTGWKASQATTYKAANAALRIQARVQPCLRTIVSALQQKVYWLTVKLPDTYEGKRLLPMPTFACFLLSRGTVGPTHLLMAVLLLLGSVEVA